MYDFHKARNDRNENVFKHKLFLKGCKFVLIIKQILAFPNKTQKWGSILSHPAITIVDCHKKIK